ncbi:hypothetical protein FQN53_007701 [Emmonsiellopsis sp. PD_33]|nr:hypothetical protein FQN53_007701 [Emmonsiellopsis sp. PD_33]
MPNVMWPDRQFMTPADLELVQARELMSSTFTKLEKNIDTRFPGRRGWPRLPFLPVETFTEPDARVYFPRFNRRLPQILRLLTENKVEHKEIMVVHRVPVGSSRRDLKSATLFIQVDCEAKPENLYNLVGDIRKYLVAHHIHVSIEVIRPVRYDEKLTVFPILPSDTQIIDNWQKDWRARVTEYMNQVSLKWTSINVLGRAQKYSRDKPTPTLIICAKDPDDDRWWDEVIPHLKESCQPLLKVDLLRSLGDFEDIPEYDCDQRRVAEKIKSECLNTELVPGASCGPADSSKFATFGGPMRLRSRDGEDLGDFAISTHHITQSEESKSACPTTSGLLANSLTTPQALVMRSPSDQDIDLKVNLLDEAIDTLQTIIEGSTWSPGVRERVEKGAAKQTQLDQLLDRASSLQAERQKFIGTDRTAGYIFASSGYRSLPCTDCGSWALDWSLTKLKEGRDNDSENKAIQRLIGGWREKPFTADGNPLSHYRRKGTSPAGLKVAKMGRTTRFERGRVNAIEAIFPPHSRYKQPSSAWVMIYDVWSYEPKLPQGDFGAAVFERNNYERTAGDWVGVAFGHNAAVAGKGLSYFTPIEAVVKDIEEVTGCEVVEPVERQQLFNDVAWDGLAIVPTFVDYSWQKTCSYAVFL